MRCLAIIVVGLLLTAPATAQTTQVLLKADSTEVSKKIDSLSKEFGAKIDRKVPGLNATILSVPTGELDKLITSANNAPGISAIETLIGSDYRQLFKNVLSADLNPATLSQAQIDVVSKLRERASSASLYFFEVRPAGISIDLLKGALTTADGFPRPKGIKLNLAPGVSVDATQTRMDQQPGGGFVWYGKIDNTDGPASQKSGVASLVVNGNRIAGTVAVDGEVYTINPLGDGMHAIVKTNPSAYPPIIHRAQICLATRRRPRKEKERSGIKRQRCGLKPHPPSELWCSIRRRCARRSQTRKRSPHRRWQIRMRLHSLAAWR